MKKNEFNARVWGLMHRYLATFAVCIFASVGLAACANGDEGRASKERVMELEATVQSLEGSIGDLADENRELAMQNASLREELETMDAVFQEMKDASANEDAILADKDQWSDSKGDRLSMPEGTAVERTARLAEEAGGVVHYIEHAGRGDTTVLVTPQKFVDGVTPLIVSLHGFGGNSADHAAYFPLHERVNSHGFALLLPTGSRNAEGFPFWNPTDECCQGGKSGEDDVGYLTELVASARDVGEFGPIYFFGYSNGGFMAHHIACKGLPGLRAVVSLAGTSYVEDSSCDGAPPVSVLQIHGTDDSVIRFEGDSTESNPRVENEPAFYAGAQEMVTRWARRAGCEWPEMQPYAIDLDQNVPGSETQVFRHDSGCAEGIVVELWVGVDSSHAPGYGDVFIDAVVEWLLEQK